MELFIVEYRDPLLGIIVLFFLIFMISLLNYKLGRRKNIKEIESIKNFIQQFDSNKNEFMILNEQNIPSDTLLLMAKFYSKQGDIQKSIDIYLSLLEKDSFINNKKERHIILSNLGNCYLKAGFLKKSKEFFMESLKLFARNKEAIKSLVILYEKMNNYEKAIEVLESLEELEGDKKREKSYLLAKIILKDKNKKFKNKIKDILNMSKDNPILIRLYLEYLIENKKEIDFEKLNEFNLKESIDILWNYIDENFKNSTNNRLIREILSAKGLIDEKIKSDIIELDILSVLKQNNYDKVMLSFEYACVECKNIFPIYFYRCPTCQSIATAEIEPIIMKKIDYNINSFL